MLLQCLKTFFQKYNVAHSRLIWSVSGETTLSPSSLLTCVTQVNSNCLECDLENWHLNSHYTFLNTHFSFTLPRSINVHWLFLDSQGKWVLNMIESDIPLINFGNVKKCTNCIYIARGHYGLLSFKLHVGFAALTCWCQQLRRKKRRLLLSELAAAPAAAALLENGLSTVLNLTGSPRPCYNWFWLLITFALMDCEV
jgi:hypothetical protein